MKLLRIGAKRKVALSKLFDKKHSILIEGGKIKLIVRDVQDIDSESSYNYTLELTFEDLLKIFEEIDETVFGNPYFSSKEERENIATAFSNSTKTLFRLLMLSSGLSNITEENEEE